MFFSSYSANLTEAKQNCISHYRAAAVKKASMRTTNTSRTQSHEAIAARAALEALFGNGDASQATTSVPDGEALVARKAAESKSVASRIDFLKRKREAMNEILREAAARGLTEDDLKSI